MYAFGLLATPSDSTWANGDTLTISILGASTSVFLPRAITPSGASNLAGFNPSGSHESAAPLFDKDPFLVGDYIADSTETFSPGDGISTFLIGVPPGVYIPGNSPTKASVLFSNNTLDRHVIPLPKKVPFNFSTTPGLIAIGAISGLNFLAKRYKQRKKDEKSNS